MQIPLSQHLNLAPSPGGSTGIRTLDGVTRTPLAGERTSPLCDTSIKSNGGGTYRWTFPAKQHPQPG